MDTISETDVAEISAPPPPETKAKSKSPEGYAPLPRVKGRPKRGGGVTCTPQTLFEYWFSLPKSEWPRLLCYVYRDWPIVDPTQVLSQDEQDKIRANKGRGGPEKNIAKWSEPPRGMNSPEEWESEILHQFGAGKYRLILNDSRGHEAEGTKGGNKTLALAYTGNIGELDTNPPDVNPDHVVRGISDNDMYVRWCHLRGIRLFGDPEPETPFDKSQEEEEAMAATAEVTRELTGTIRELVGQAREERRREPVPTPPVDAGNAVSSAVEHLTKANDAALKIVSSAFDRANQTTDSKSDPMAIVEKVIELAKTFQPAGDKQSAPAPSANDSLIQQLLEDRRAQNKRLEELEKRYMDGLEARLAAAEARAVNTSASPSAGNPIIEALKIFKEMGNMKETLADVLGLGGADEEPPQSKLDTLIKVGGPILNNIVSTVGSAFYNAAALKNGGKPMPPGDVQNLNPQATPNPNPAIPQGSPNNMMDLIKAVTDPLKTAVVSGQDGAEFAAHVILQFGSPAVQAYNQMLEAGAALPSYIAMYPPLGGFATEHAAQFDRFLGEFLDVPRVNEIITALQTAAAAGAAGGNQPTPGPRKVKRPAPPQPPTN